MDPNLNERLSAIEKKLDENNAMLKKMRRSQRAAAAVKLVYWGILIALGIISISFIKPYLTQLKDAYGLGDTNSANYADMLKQFNQ